MTPHDDENNWAELADALGIDTPATQARKQAAAPPPPEPEQPPPLPDWALVTDDLPDAAETDGDTMLEPLLATGSADEVAADGKGEGDRKRRRRRRRRKPGDPVNPATAEADGDEESEDTAPAATAEAEDEDEEEAPKREPELVGVGIADEPTPDAVRDLISNWNVPSWQEIVTGLYRPGGDRSGG